MGLPPLEYIDCFLDSPNFREIIGLYEKELESNSQYVKALVKECRNMIAATEGNGMDVGIVGPCLAVEQHWLFR